MGRIAAAATVAGGALLGGAPAWAQDSGELIGQPTDGGIGLQPAASPLMEQARQFHDFLLVPIIAGICLLVLGLLLWVIIRYNKRANPTPARWSHNTLVEVIWTVVPVLILVVIAVPSFRLLYAYHDMPKPDVTVKVTGNQWNWTYEYPDHGVGEFVSSMLPEAEAKAAGKPYRLGVDEPMVVPAGRTVRLLITGSDVIHAVALPAFGLKTDAVPGRVNETWFRADRPGVYYGQCSELCGVDHAFMPIEIHVVSEAEFARWVASKGGSMTFAADQARAAAEKARADAAAKAAAAAAAAPTAAGEAGPAGAPGERAPADSPSGATPLGTAPSAAAATPPAATGAAAPKAQ